MTENVPCRNMDTVAFALDVYGHVTDKMKKQSADRMQDTLLLSANKNLIVVQKHIDITKPLDFQGVSVRSVSF